MHGFVPEEVKAELYARAWVNITTSAAEGWGLTVMEAASHATPSAALRVGGLAESIVDGDTGVLADDISELTTKVAAIIESPELRERLGAAAALRAQGFSWDVAAAQLLAMLVSAAEARRRVKAPWRPFPAARPKRVGGTREPLVMEHGEPLVADSVNDS
jgi:glycosyltransferase involved in cell wall biosynthesis